MTVNVDVKLGVPEGGLNDPDTPLGAPDRLRATLSPEPDTKPTFTVKVVLPPGVTVCDDGEAEIEKSNCWAGCTTRVASASWLTPFAEPTKAIGYVPAGVEGDVVTLKVGGEGVT